MDRSGQAVMCKLAAKTSAGVLLEIHDRAPHPYCGFDEDDAPISEALTSLGAMTLPVR